MKLKFRIEEKGGPGSGHRGHSGRPGKRGGSMPGSSAGSSSGGKNMVTFPAKTGGVFGGYDTWEDLQIAHTREHLAALSAETQSLLSKQGVDMNTRKPLATFVESLTQTQARRIMDELQTLSNKDLYYSFRSLYDKTFDELYGKRSELTFDIFSGLKRK